jgi:AcrR family transcriptional regulator
MRSTVRKSRIPNPESRVSVPETAARAGTLLPATPGPAHIFIPQGVPRLEQIRRVGCQLLYQYGYSGMTMRQIAAHLNIKAASLYHHFPSKQDILCDLMFDTAFQLMEGLLRIADPAKEAERDPREQLSAAIRWHVLFHTRKREEAFVSHSELRSLTPQNLDEILTVRQHYDQVFDYLLRRCQKAGVIPKGDTSVVRNAILTMCTATAGWFNPEGKLTADQVADQMVEFVWQGLLRAPGKERPAARPGRAHEGEHGMAEWHREALREPPPVPVTEFKPSPILEALRKLIAAKHRQLEREKTSQSE